MSFQPNDLGQSTLAITEPTGFATSAAGLCNVVATVTGDQLTLRPITLGAGIYIKLAVDLPSTPGTPISVTVTLADPTLARLSTDATVMGTASTLTFNNITNFDSGNAGGVQPFYIQGIAPG